MWAQLFLEREREKDSITFTNSVPGNKQVKSYKIDEH